MCKIFVVTNAAQVDIAKLVEKGVTPLSYGNQDGFGWLAMAEHGLYGKKAVSNSSITQEHSTKASAFGVSAGLVHKFGRPGIENKFFAMHSRKSTNQISINNTHPMLNEDLTFGLVHNGVVRTTKNYPTLTTNDSELLLRAFEKGGVSEIEKNIQGYYATAIMDVEGREMHLLRDDQARLFVTWSDTIQSLIFCTSDDDIKTICRDMAWEHEAIEPCYTNMYARFSESGECEVQPLTKRPEYVEPKRGRRSSKWDASQEDEEWYNKMVKAGVANVYT